MSGTVLLHPVSVIITCSFSSPVSASYQTLCACVCVCMRVCACGAVWCGVFVV